MGLVQTLLSIGSLNAAALAVAALLFAVAFYRLHLHPLSHIPGPWFAAVSSVWMHAICYFGVEGHVLLDYHRKYKTAVLRIGPDSVSIADGEALHQVYVAGGGLPKDARYSNFRVEGHDTIFSAVDQNYRDRRAKAVLPLFAPSRIQSAYETDGVMEPLVAKFVAQLQEARAKPDAKIDVLDLCSRLSIDILTAYLFGCVYGGLDEPRRRPQDKLSATPFVLTIVALSRFSLLSNRLFTLLFSVLFHHRMRSDPELAPSLQAVSRFAESVVDGPSSKADTYQSRLRDAGIDREETLVQCKAVMFAGADSTAVVLATILFHLVQNPQVRERARAEASTAADPQSLPYLRAIVREGLRVAMANPARLTRLVPTGGLRLADGTYLPAGTKVGAAAYVLHHDPAVYPDPFVFRPERWLAAGQASTDAQARNAFAFGLGPRACLGRNLANHQLHAVVKAVLASGVLEGARTCTDRIRLIEWFNAEIKGHELEIAW
ncbi:64036f13-ab24-4d8d-bf5d-c5fc4dba6a48 [Thermothielavioides terrestris]|jgi:cytochrome P450|uniref:Cytochrome P450 n=2 Tax=Thermothielavioides terrestris TaxID=2587410 RepID=G2R8K2_THETT|nr:uncharacterized protein THITE_2088904 [Thermothielavioides terrestris NRRL 8126]AEO67417.1 hypothetical protein THITE_2088904 [Thermothielavioides terrestris NRRL 8126]SPQ24129.1 64036f13-ab24-4d8d-bf5d-c5fc4dba6a48 [Thermothielavioides terrestris]